jgi:surfeit locus 1 family protein
MIRFPALPTIVVGAAVAVMIGLGVWQLQRAQWKEALLARYETASALAPIAWPAVPGKSEELYFRKAAGFCLEVTGWRPTAGRNLKGESGWSFIAGCRTGAEGPGMQVDMGWSKQSVAPAGWRGGPVSGVIAPDEDHRIRLVSVTPAPGLEASAPPSPDTIPNNHFFYALQWFFFAAAAAIIYLIALRRRQKPAETPAP